MKTDRPASEIPPNPNLPMPGVAHVSNENLNLDDLGDRDLETYITYPEIAVGQEVAPNFRGRAEHGMSHDLLTDKRVITNLDSENRFTLEIPNSLVKQLKGGQVFYSFYRVKDDNFVDQSRRTFFFVHREQQGGLPVGLPVLQLQQSHELKVDLKALGSDDGVLAVLPYRAMAEGDEVTFIYQQFLFEGDDEPFDEWTFTEVIKQEQIGQAVLAALPNAVLFSAQELFCTMFYRITYKDIEQVTESPVQVNLPSLEVPAPALLAPPIINGLVGSNLDPDEWPDGVTVHIPFHEDMLAGAGVVLFIGGKESSIQAVQLDPSSADSQRVEFHLSHQWLRDRRNQDVSLRYQYGIAGKDGRSEALDLTVQAELMLQPASVDNALIDEDDNTQSFISGWNIRDGAKIILPSKQDLPADPMFTVYWDGHEVFKTSTPTGSPNHYLVPKQYIPANLGKRVRVYYEVQFDEGKPQPSPDHFLVINDFPTSRWTTLITPDHGSTLSLGEIEDATGVPMRLDYWFFMDTGQKVHIEAVASVGGENKTFIIRNESGVTEEEADQERIHAVLTKADLNKIDHYTDFEIRVRVSFDGETYKDFPYVRKTLVP